MSATPPPIPDFALLRPIGRGAYGEVWLARSVTGVYRAVKIVRRDSFNEDRPFEREFAGIQRFEPVSVGQESQVSLLHVGRNDAEGFFYYVMELADDTETGEEIFPDRYVPKTLKELRNRQKRLPATECLDIGLALTRALAHLHESGLVHRDIKPSNVIFVHGIAKLADIGLVSNIDTSHSFVGTEGFVPPEGPGTAAADIFSLGKVLYEISTGRDRTEFPNLPVDLDDVPDRRALLELNEIVLKACDSDLQRRYASAAAMREDLLLLQAGRSVRRLHLMERRLRFIVEYGVIATVVCAMAIAGFLWASSQTRKANENLARAERAETEARARLHEANFNLARANRLAGRTGFRFNNLPELARAAADTNRLDYRNEAIASLALPDLRPLKQWAKTPYWDSFNFSHDFRSYGTNDVYGNIHIRDTATDELVRTLPTRGAPLTGSVSSSDGRYVATSDAFGRAWLWTDGSSSPLAVPFGSDSKLVGFTPDNALLMVRPSSDMVDFINVTNGGLDHTLSGLPPSRSIQISPTGVQLMFVEGNRVHIHSRSDGTRVRTLTLPDAIGASAWHPDGLRVALVWGRSIGVYEVASGKQRALGVGHESAIVGLTFDESGDWLITASWDRTTRLWRSDTVREVARLGVAGNGLRLSPDGRRLAFKSWDHATVQLFEVADTDVVQRFQIQSSRYTYRTVFHPSGQWLAAVDESAITFFQPPHAAPVGRMEIAGTGSLAFLADGHRLLTGGGRGLRFWPVKVDEAGREIVIGPRQAETNTFLKLIHYFLVSGDERWCVAIAKAEGGPFAFEMGNANSMVEFDPAAVGIHLHTLNRDGTLALARNERRPTHAQFWNPRTGRLAASFETGLTVRQTALSPDERWIAVSGLGATTIWSRDTFQLRHRIAHPDAEENRYTLAFSPDGRLLAVAVSDREIWLIDVESGTTLASLPVDRLVVSLSFSAAGNQLAVTGEGGWFEVWNLHLLRKKLSDLHLDWPAAPMTSPSNGTTAPAIFRIQQER
jgi:serine/threonine protein kinase